MKKRALPVNHNGTVIGYMIFCPACECGHLFYTNYNAKSNWSFDGNLENPTFNPSMLVYRSPTGGQKRCHSFVRDGKIQFLGDCEHELKGQTVELPIMDKE